MKRMIAVLACALVLSACGNQSDSDKNHSKDQGDQGSAQTSQSQDASKNQSNNGGKDADGFADKNAKRSYALGMDIGNSVKDLPLKVNLDQLTAALRDVVESKKTRMSPKEQRAVMKGIVADMEAAEKKKQQLVAQNNLEQGQQFLAENKKKDGVKTLEDGLQYKVIKKGDGPQPGAHDTVTVKYTGKLVDGTVFDSSKKQGKPATFPVDAVIPGWTEALQHMHVGGEYKLFIPPELAYGKRGAGSKIGPNETLIFDVTLVGMKKAGDQDSSNSGAQQNATDSGASQGGDD